MNKHSRFVIIILLISSLAFGVNSEMDIEALLDEAADYLYRSEYDKAELIYRQLLETDSSNVLAAEGLLYSLSKQKRFTLIIEAIEEFGLTGSSAELWNAYSKYMSAKYIESIAAYKDMLKKDANNEMALSGLGWSYIDFGYYQYAKSLFNKSLKSNNDYSPSIDGRQLANQYTDYLYAQVSWLDNDNMTANPSIYLLYSKGNFQTFFLIDYFQKKYAGATLDMVTDNNNDNDNIFSRSSFTSAYRFYLNRFIVGANIYYLTSSNQALYDAKGALLLLQDSFSTPFFLVDYGVSLGRSKYKFGATWQEELFSHLHFDYWSLKPSVTMINYKDDNDIDSHSEVVYELKNDYYFNKELVLRFNISVGEKMLMLNKNGYVIDKKDDLPKWELDTGLSYRKNGYLLSLGIKFDEKEITTYYGGAGITVYRARK